MSIIVKFTISPKNSYISYKIFRQMSQTYKTEASYFTTWVLKWVLHLVIKYLSKFTIYNRTAFLCFTTVFHTIFFLFKLFLWLIASVRRERYAETWYVIRIDSVVCLSPCDRLTGGRHRSYVVDLVSRSMPGCRVTLQRWSVQLLYARTNESIRP